MRTTVRLDDRLLAEAKQLAARTGRTLTSVMDEALRLLLSRGVRAPRRTHVKLPTVRGNGLQPGVDLDDTAGLLDLMDERRAPR